MNPERKQVPVHCAHGSPCTPCIIYIERPVPEFGMDGWEKKSLQLFIDEADTIVSALVASLPGGTLSQVHARLAQHFADKCLLRVTS
jgi:hypothetical protein